jgi:hypothetical protein
MARAIRVAGRGAVALALGAAVMTFAGASAQAGTTWTFDGSQPLQTVVDGASDNDTIQIAPGTYASAQVVGTGNTVTITKILTIQGQSTTQHTELQYALKSVLFHITSPTTLVGFQLTGVGDASTAGTGILYEPWQPLTIRQCTIAGFHDGISEDASTADSDPPMQLTIENTTITGNQRGLFLDNSQPNWPVPIALNACALVGNLSGAVGYVDPYASASPEHGIKITFTNCVLDDQGVEYLNYNVGAPPPTVHPSYKGLNLIGNTDGLSPSPTEGDPSVLLDLDPQLGTLADNGGPTDTFLPRPTSPLKAATTGSLTQDQQFHQRGATTAIGPVDLPATTLTVSGEGTTIADALAQLGNGDTLLIEPGTHTISATLSVNRNLTIACSDPTSHTELVEQNGDLLDVTAQVNLQVGDLTTIRGLELSTTSGQNAGIHYNAVGLSTLRVDSCTITGFGTGVVFNAGDGSALDIVNSTITGNGTGLSLAPSDEQVSFVNLSSSAVVANSADGVIQQPVPNNGLASLLRLQIKNTIVSENGSDFGRAFDQPPAFLGANLIGSVQGVLAGGQPVTVGPNDILGKASLAPLSADNGGSTSTMLPSPESPVNGVVALADVTDESGAPLAYDQRGVARGAVTSIGPVDAGLPQAATQGSITALASTVGGINTIVGGINGAVSTLQGTANQIQSETSGLVTSLSGVPSVLSAVSQSVGNANTTLGIISSKVDTANTSLGALANNVGALIRDVGVESNPMTGLGAMITSLQTTVSGLATAASVSTLQGTANAIKTTVTGIQSTLNTTGTDVAAGLTTLTNYGNGQLMLVPVAVVQRISADLAANNTLSVTAVLPVAHGGQLEWMQAIVHQDYANMVGLVGAGPVANAAGLLAAADQDLARGQFAEAAVAYGKAERALLGAVP